MTRQTDVGQDGTGDGNGSHTDVCNRERDQEVVGDSAQLAVEAHSNADEYVADGGEKGNNELSSHVPHIRGNYNATRWRQGGERSGVVQKRREWRG